MDSDSHWNDQLPVWRQAYQDNVELKDRYKRLARKRHQVNQAQITSQAQSGMGGDEFDPHGRLAAMEYKAALKKGEQALIKAVGYACHV